MKNLKDYRNKELTIFIVANILLFHVIHQFIKVDANELFNATEVFSQIFTSVIMSVIAFGFILVTECLLTSGTKEKLLYLFGFFGLLNLPGCMIFTNIKNKNIDSRFSYQNLIIKYPTLYENLPESKEERLRYENEKWYAIYSQNRDVPMIYNSQRDWLLFRDIYITTLVIICLYIVLIKMSFVEFSCPYLLFLITMAIITNFGTNRKAARFAYNVIAYDVHTAPEKEKKGDL